MTLGGDGDQGERGRVVRDDGWNCDSYTQRSGFALARGDVAAPFVPRLMYAHTAYLYEALSLFLHFQITSIFATCSLIFV